MLKRISVTTLLTSIVLFMATCIVAMLAVNAWQSFDRLKAAGRISVIAGLSRDAFVAMHRLRTDRSTTNRTLNGDAVLNPELEKIIREFRDSELPALRGVMHSSPLGRFSRAARAAVRTGPADADHVRA